MLEIILSLLKMLVQAVLPELPALLREMLKTEETVEIHDGTIPDIDDNELYSNNELDGLLRK